MAKVTGLGGVFFRADDTKALGDWYKKWLGLPVEHPFGASIAHKQLSGEGSSVWAPFEHDTKYFGESGQSFMINLMVDFQCSISAHRNSRMSFVRSGPRLVLKICWAWASPARTSRRFGSGAFLYWLLTASKSPSSALTT